MKRWIVGGVVVAMLALATSVAWVLLTRTVTVIEIDSAGRVRTSPATPEDASPAAAAAAAPSNNFIDAALPALAPDQLFAAASPAVAQVQLMDAAMLPIGQGTGFFVSADGYLVTNFHVIRDAAYATVITADGLAHSVEGVAAANEEADLALLKVKLATDRVATLRLAPGSSAAPAIGTRVFAIGNPRGLTNTLSDGLVSGHRDALVPGVRIVQISAPIGPGSSGGPLMTADGAVVGVTSSGFSDGQNLNFAIPSERVHALLASKGATRPLTAPENANPISAAMANARASTREQGGDRVVIVGIGGAHDASAAPRPDRSRRAGGRGASPRDASIPEHDLDLLAAAARALDRGDTRAAAGLLRELRPRSADVDIYWGLDGLLNEKLGQFDLAVRSYRKAAALNPKSPQAYTGLGRALSGIGDDAAAIDAFAAAAKLEPTSANAYLSAGVSAARMKDYKRALSFFDYAIKLAPRDADAYRLKGMALADLKRTTEAFAAYDQALRLDPKHAKTHFVRGQLKLRLNRPGDAIDSLKRAIALDPKHAAAHVTLGDAYDACGEKGEALKAWVAATRLDKSGTSGQMARARLERATMGLTRIE